MGASRIKLLAHSSRDVVNEVLDPTTLWATSPAVLPRMIRIKGLSICLLVAILQGLQVKPAVQYSPFGNPSLDFTQRAAEALDVSVAELLGSQPKAVRGKPGPNPHNCNSASIRSDDSPAKNRSSSSALSTLS